MRNKPRVFLDTSALFAGLWSESGGARMIFKLGEADLVHILVGSQVLAEIEEVLRRKAPQSLANLALLLDHCRVENIQSSSKENHARCQDMVKHSGDAQVLAEAWSSDCDYFVTLDREHFLGNIQLTGKVHFPIGTPGDFLNWYRQQIDQNQDEESGGAIIE